MKPVQIEALGLAKPRRFSQDETFQMAGYTSPRILEIFRNCGIDFGHFYVAPGPIRQETAGDLNRRYLSGALKTAAKRWPRACKRGGAT